MKIVHQENEITLLRLGPARSEAEVVKRELFFEIKGQEYSCDVLLERNATGEDYDDPENFYQMNKEMVDAALTLFLSENHLYNNLDKHHDNE